MNLLSKGNIIPSLEMHLAEITPRQIERRGAQLQKIARGDKVLEGEISELGKTFYTLGMTLKSRMIECRAKAERADDDAENMELMREAVLYSCLSEIAVDMAWHEMHSSVDYWDGPEIGVRQNWVPVIPAKNRGPESFFRGIGLLPPDED